MKGAWSVLRHYDALDRWYFVQGSAGRKSYAQGWFDALTSLIPRSAYRLVDDKEEIREERGACRGIQVNSEQEEPNG